MGDSREREGKTLDDLREQFRMQRHREILNTALRIVVDEGIGAVTMQRMADELDCAIGTIYQYVPSKGALMAELQREALDILGASLTLHRSYLDELIDDKGLDERRAALARVVGVMWFWIGAEDVFPWELEVSRRLFTAPSILLSDEEATRVLPAGVRLLEVGARAFSDAADAGALHPGDGSQRAVIMVAGTTGVQLTKRLERFDPDLFNSSALATEMARALFLGWGADPEGMDEVEDVVALLAERGRLIPLVPSGRPEA